MVSAGGLTWWKASGRSWDVWCNITALMSLKVPPSWASLVTQLVKNPPAEPETQV